MTTAPASTSRFRFRELRADDLDSLAALYADPGTSQWLGDGSVRDRRATAALLERYLALYEDRGYGLWALESSGGTFIGQCGLQPLDDGSDVALSYALAPAFRGHGYAVEAAAVVLDHGFGRLGLRRIVAVAQPANEASVRVMKRLGMAYEKEAVHYGKPVVVYAATRESFSHAASGRAPGASFHATAGRTAVWVRDAGLSGVQREWRIAVDGRDRGVLPAAWWDTPLVAIGTREVLVLSGPAAAVVPLPDGALRTRTLEEPAVAAFEQPEGWLLVHPRSASLWNAATGATLARAAFPEGARWGGWRDGRAVCVSAEGGGVVDGWRWPGSGS